MTLMNSNIQEAGRRNTMRAQHNFAQLMTHVASLYCMDGSSSLSQQEMAELTLSIAYTLGLADATPEEAIQALCVEDPVALWHSHLAELDCRIDNAPVTWKRIVLAMPPIRNVALRDTLASLGDLKSRYDTRFAAHTVPCDIDYQLSEPIDISLRGLDYIEAWLAQLERETMWIAQFDVDSCISTLERACPDYRGLHINLYDLLSTHASELEHKM